jgi:hypothetical protein
MFIKVRHFIVVKSRSHHSLCIPISTYRGKGVTNRPDAKHHSIIYDTTKVPAALPGEQLEKYDIQMERADGCDPLAASSRINYAQTYTVQHNVKVKGIGKISGVHMTWVKKYWRECIDDD